MQDDDIFLRIKDETPYLKDDGFSLQVLQALPVRRKIRLQVLGLSWASALLAGLVIWFFNHTAAVMFDFKSGLILGGASLAFWLVFGLFAFVAIDEGVFEV